MILEKTPRVQIATAEICSTSQLDQAIREGENSKGHPVSPITVYSSHLETKRRAHKNVISIQLAIYSRLAAVLPNIDSIRMLSRKTQALEAMKLTDRNLGLVGVV